MASREEPALNIGITTPPIAATVHSVPWPAHRWSSVAVGGLACLYMWWRGRQLSDLFFTTEWNEGEAAFFGAFDVFG